MLLWRVAFSFLFYLGHSDSGQLNSDCSLELSPNLFDCVESEALKGSRTVLLVVPSQEVKGVAELINYLQSAIWTVIICETHNPPSAFQQYSTFHKYRGEPLMLNSITQTVISYPYSVIIFFGGLLTTIYNYNAFAYGPIVAKQRGHQIGKIVLTTTEAELMSRVKVDSRIDLSRAMLRECYSLADGIVLISDTRQILNRLQEGDIEFGRTDNLYVMSKEEHMVKTEGWPNILEAIVAKK